MPLPICARIGEERQGAYDDLTVHFDVSLTGGQHQRSLTATPPNNNCQQR